MQLRKLWCLALLPLSPCDAVEFIAHRGASYDAPENTLAALRLGWEQSADADELDIQLTQDRKIVVIHDSTTKRTTGLDKTVAQLTLDELRALDAGSWKGPAWRGEKIPTLREAIDAIPPQRKLFIEIKSGAEILPELESTLNAVPDKQSQLILIGFNYDTMRLAKKSFPRIPAYWLVSWSADKKTGAFPELGRLIEKAAAAHLDGLNLDQKFPIDRKFVEQVKAAGLKLYTWTVNDAALARSLRDAGVDGITTDRPAWLRQQLQ